MRISQLIIIFSLLLFYNCEQELNGDLLLNKAIAYHDPDNHWSTLQDSLLVVMETPDQSNRVSRLYINLPDDQFYVKSTRDTLSTEYIVKKDSCTIKLNGEETISEADLLANNLSCERATMYKNYYTYLYGLPMKLKDPGTNIDPVIETKTFKGKEYLVLKASYDKDVGNDVWFFYLDPETYAMEIYQFYKTDENGEMLPDSGEYILLTEETSVSGIKMPKVRAWYYNKDDKYLGTDVLN